MRHSLYNVKKTTDKPKIWIPVILHEDECVTNAARGYIESEDIKKWIPRPMECVIESINARKTTASLIRYPMPEAKIIKHS